MTSPLSKHERNAITARLEAGETVTQISLALGISETSVRTVRASGMGRVYRTAKPVKELNEWTGRIHNARWGNGWGG